MAKSITMHAIQIRTDANFKAVRVLLGGVKHERKQDIRGSLCIKVQLADIDREEWVGSGLMASNRIGDDSQNKTSSANGAICNAATCTPEMRQISRDVRQMSRSARRSQEPAHSRQSSVARA
jgi:hypothetical protein